MFSRRLRHARIASDPAVGFRSRVAALVLLLLSAAGARAAGAADVVSAEDLLARLRGSERADLQRVPELAGAAVGEGLLIRDYVDLEPLYVLSPLLADGRVIGIVATDPSSGQWWWYTLSYHGGSFPSVSGGEAADRAAAGAKAAGRDVAWGSPVAVRAPDRRIYWQVPGRAAAGACEVLVDLDDPGAAVASSLDGSIGRAVVPGGSPARVRPPEGWTAPRASRALKARPAVYNIPEVPFHFQETSWFCGPACGQMLFDSYGEKIGQFDISDVENDDTGWGTYASDNLRACHFSAMSTAIQNPALRGYAERSLGYSGNVAYLHDDPYDGLKDQIAAGVPVQILTCYDAGCSTGHYRVVKGYDDVLDEFIVHDPWYSTPFYGPDVHFNQGFLVLQLWDPWSYCWGLVTGPWTFDIAMPAEVEPGGTFDVRAGIKYPGEGYFAGQYGAYGGTATISLPAGFSLASGSATVPIPTLWSGDSTAVTWSVVAGAAQGEAAIGIGARGVVSGSSYSYPAYSDSIGGHSRGFLWVGDAEAGPWSAEERVTNDAGGSTTTSPSGRALFAEPDGTLHLVWADTRDGNSEIYYSRNDGAWGAPVRLTNDAGFSDSPAIAGLPDGTLHVVWADRRGGNTDLYYRRCDAGAWSGETRLTTETAADVSPAIAADASGNVLAAWECVRSSWTRVRYTRWNGSVWSAVADVGQASNLSARYPSLAADALGRFHLVYEQETSGSGPSNIHYKVFTGSWSAPVAVTTDPAYSHNPSIAVGPDGRVHVAWHDGRDLAGEIYYRCLDGVSWGPETNISEGEGDSQRASVATDQYGRPCVVWEDHRDGRADLYHAFLSWDGWTEPRRVSRERHDSTLATLAVDGIGRNYAAWTDTRDGNTEIYFSRRGSTTVGVPSGPAPGARPLIAAVWPVPSCSGSVIEFEVPERSAVLLRVFDVAGRHVRTVVSGTLAAGIYRAEWDGANTSGRRVAPGVYFCRLAVGAREESRPQVILGR